MSETLFCTDTFWAEHGDRVREVAPDLDVVQLVEGQTVSDEDRERITICFFSHDAWPERAADFMITGLGAANLRWLHTMSAGLDNPIFSTFAERGVALSNSSGSSARPIARTAMMFLLALSRDLPRMMRAQQAHEWDWHRWNELEGQRVAVLGFGPIGQEIVRLADAFGMEPVVVRRAAKGDEPCTVRPLSELRDVVAEVDATVVALPLTDDTRDLFDADTIAAMRPGSFFVNVGRGELVDQPALVEALRDGRLGGAGLDVFATEPLPADDPIWDLPNVIITPHNSGSTDGTGRRAAERFLTNLAAWVAGDDLPDAATPT